MLYVVFDFLGVVCRIGCAVGVVMSSEFFILFYGLCLFFLKIFFYNFLWVVKERLEKVWFFQKIGFFVVVVWLMLYMFCLNFLGDSEV